MCNESLFYLVFYDDKTSVYTPFKFLKNQIIKYPVSCILHPVTITLRGLASRLSHSWMHACVCAYDAVLACLRVAEERKEGRKEERKKGRKEGHHICEACDT